MENFTPSPLSFYPRISAALRINFYAKHDDLLPFTGGGSKVRKIFYILKKATAEGANAVVSAGAANSNHARVTALMAAQLGWKCIMIVHDDEDYSKGNLLLMKLAGAELRFVKLSEVKDAMDNAMAELTAQNFKPFYIYGGGHTVEGAAAYYYAVSELADQAVSFQDPVSYIVHASGTGGTQAGLHIGAKRWLPNCKVIGISVARGKERGLQAVRDAALDLCQLVNENKNWVEDLDFRPEWTGSGYDGIYPSLLKDIQWAAEEEGLITDPTYSGKALTAMIDMCRSGEIQPGSTVVFWHTGGLINLFSHYKEFLL